MTLDQHKAHIREKIAIGIWSSLAGFSHDDTISFDHWTFPKEVKDKVYKATDAAMASMFGD